MTFAKTAGVMFTAICLGGTQISAQDGPTAPVELESQMSGVEGIDTGGLVDFSQVIGDYSEFQEGLAKWTDRPDWVTPFLVESATGTGGALGIEIDKLPVVDLNAEPGVSFGEAFADKNGKVWVCATCMTPGSPLGVTISLGMPGYVRDAFPGALPDRFPRSPMTDNGIAAGNVEIVNPSSKVLSISVSFPIQAGRSIFIPHHGQGEITGTVYLDPEVLREGRRYEIRPSDTKQEWVLVEK